jgi:hypothetical protein
MARENRSEQNTAATHKPPKDLSSSTPPSPQSGPRIANDGPESPRSNLC